MIENTDIIEENGYFIKFNPSEEIIFIDCAFDNTRHEQIDVDNEQE